MLVFDDEHLAYWERSKKQYEKFWLLTRECPRQREDEIFNRLQDIESKLISNG